MSIYQNFKISPMLIGKESEPFFDKKYLYELKFDGERCLAYIEKDNTLLINKRGVKMLPKVPELKSIHKNCKTPCLLDGELLVIKNGKPDFFEIQKRSLTSNPFKIKLMSEDFPACFTAFDILYYKNKSLIDVPLIKRKELLLDNIIKEDDKLSVSKHFAEGDLLYDFALKNKLEGIVAKEKESLYYPSKRTKEWIKIKCLQDDDFIIIGYKEGDKASNLSSLLLGQFKNEKIVYIGNVSVGKKTDVFNKTKALKRFNYDTVKTYKNAIYVEPKLVCTVKFMMRTSNGGLRQPVFKSLRYDKNPKECLYNNA